MAAVQLTALLKAWSSGDESVLDRLTPLVYDQLYRLARGNMAGERPGHVLQPSALVNEAFVRLMSAEPGEWNDRTHFFAFSARLMRQILVDCARAQNSNKRGNRVAHFGLSAAEHIAANRENNHFLDLDAALDELAGLQPRQARVVELRYFGGLENAEIAALLGVSADTVMRDWRTARAWLYDRLRLRNQEGEAAI